MNDEQREKEHLGPFLLVNKELFLTRYERHPQLSNLHTAATSQELRLVWKTEPSVQSLSIRREFWLMSLTSEPHLSLLLSRLTMLSVLSCLVFSCSVSMLVELEAASPTLSMMDSTHHTRHRRYRLVTTGTLSLANSNFVINAWLQKVRGTKNKV